MAENKNIGELDELPGTGPAEDVSFVVFSPEHYTGEEGTGTFRIPAERLPGGIFPANEPPAAIAQGNIPAGYELANKDALVVLRQLLSQPFQFPSFASFTRDGQGSLNVEVGTIFPAGFKSFTWSANNSQNVTAGSISLRDETTNTALATGETNDGTLSASTVALTATPGEFRRYRLYGMNSQGGSFTADIVLAGYQKSYLGYSTATSLTDAQINALANGELAGGKARSFNGVTASGGAYTYYAYPAEFGDLSNIIMDGAAPVFGAFTRLADVVGVNALGAPVTRRVYRSNSTNAFTNNSLAFS